MNTLTVLHHPMAALVKTWRPDGTIVPYGLAKHFTVESVPVDSFTDLVSLLVRLAGNPRAAVIRGTYPHETPAIDVTRTMDHFEDRPLHPILIEVDGYEPLTCDPLLDPVTAITEYIAVSLSSCFHQVSCYWQLSNSAGHPKHVGTLKVHLWFWLDTPYTSGELRAWATATNLASDHSVFHPIQLHYTGAPLFEPGVVDPVPLRSGTIMTDRVSVPLCIPDEILETVHASASRSRSPILGAVQDDVAAYLTAHGLVVSRNAHHLCLTCPWDDAHTSGTVGDSSTVWLLAGSHDFVQGRFKCSHAHCHDKTAADFLDAIGFLREGFDILPDYIPPAAVPSDLVEDTAVTLGTGADGVLPPRPRLELTADGSAIKARINNVYDYLTWRAACGHWVRFDAFRDEIVLHTDRGPRPFTDADYTRLAREAERGIGSFQTIPHDMMRRAVHNVAQDVIFDSAKEWLHQLPPWDGIDRLTTFMEIYLGASGSTTVAQAYATAVSLYLWSAMAGRILNPGSQTDMVVILASPQGTGKSSAVRAMAPAPSYYTEINLTDSDADRARLTRGKSLVELSELRGLRTKDLDAIKAIVTRREDSWVPKYFEISTTYSRRFLMIGTTNDLEFLADPSGARRWLPITVGIQDVTAISRDHAQLWAQAVVLFQTYGICWHEAQTLAVDEHEQFTVADSWEEIVTIYLQNSTQVGVIDTTTVCQILQVGLQIPVGQHTRSHEMRVAAILRKLGWTRSKIQAHGVRGWCWTCPKGWFSSFSHGI